jgi:TPR repeat protein
MRHFATGCTLLFALSVLSGLPAYAQGKTACELLSKADAEAILGVTLQPPKPSAPFRSLLDPDFTTGTPEQGCTFTNLVGAGPEPPKVVNVRVEIRYSSTANAHAVDEARKQVDARTYDHPTDLPGLGDAAFWIGAPNNVTLFVFLGGTTRLMIGPSQVGLEPEKALAAKALASLGKTGSFTYGAQPTGLTKPLLGKPGPGASGIEQLKRALTAKADRGDVKAQRTLGQLYQYSTLAPDGSAQPDYAGAAYWYQQASAHGDAQAAYELAMLYHDGLGVAVDASLSFQLLQKAAEAGYVPAMPLLSDLYADQKTATSRERATDWATRAADAGDPGGWLRLGFEYDMGKLGGDPPYWYQKAMESYKKAAAGGNCVAMMAIADLYAKGKGVPADTTQAQSWQAKSESCQDGNIAVVQQQVARYRARAAAGRDPALYPVLAALPTIPSPPAQAGRNNSTPTADRSGFNRRIVVGLVAAAVVVIAAGLLVPDPPAGNSNDCCADQNYKAQMALQDQSRCYRVASSGLDSNLYGC